jgi:hypothetical protein
LRHNSFQIRSFFRTLRELIPQLEGFFKCEMKIGSSSALPFFNSEFRVGNLSANQMPFRREPTNPAAVAAMTPG